MYKIKFGVDGWKGIIARDFTVENVARLAAAIALWLTRKTTKPSAVIGYDTRFGGEMFLEIVTKVLAARGVKTYIPEDFVTSPMVSVAVNKLAADCGIIITASHYTAEYNGIKIKGAKGGPLDTNELKDIEVLIAEDIEVDYDMVSWNAMINQHMIQYIDLESIYLKELHDNFDLESVDNAGNKLVIDPMYGSSQHILKKIFKNAVFIHDEINPTFKGIAPDPNSKNLAELASFVDTHENASLGVAIDGDADRLILVNEKGEVIDANHLMLLLIHYLTGYKKQKGKVITGFAASTKIETLCEHYGIEVERHKVGFSGISKKIIEDKVILGGEANGGMCVSAKTPERDAVWVLLVLLQCIHETQKSLNELLNEIYKITGKFAFKQADFIIQRKHINKILDLCKHANNIKLGNENVIRVESLDGFRLFVNDKEWVLFRKSTKEPVLRAYFQAESNEKVEELINAAQEFIFKHTD